jgi:ribose transport system permease protein
MREGEYLLLKARSGLGSEYKDVMVLCVGIVVLMAIMGFAAEGFLSWYNLHNVLKDFSILLTVSSGMTIAILLGKIDMSAGSVMSLSAIATTLTLASGRGIVFAIAIGILSGMLVGLFNGYMIGVQKLNHFIVTFATMSIAKGIALIACNGEIINGAGKGLLFIGTGKFRGLFIIVWMSVIIFMALYWLLKKSQFGYKIYSIGGSESVAKLSGIDTNGVYIESFALIGILSAIGGIFIAGKANSGNVTMGDGFEFNAIATVLIGGTPFDGGRGGLLGTFVGAFLISILKNGISFLGLTPAWQYAIIGIVILVVIVVDVTLNERRKREESRRVWQ